MFSFVLFLLVLFCRIEDDTKGLEEGSCNSAAALLWLCHAVDPSKGDLGSAE
jgi:hypothetical protein